MIHDRRLWAAVTIFLLGGGALYYCSAPPDDGNGGRDGSTDPIAEPAEDTAVDAPANDATEPDVGTDAATEDVAVDVTVLDAPLDVTDASPDVADATVDVDAGLWVVTACALLAPSPNANTQIVVSDGKVYRTSWFGSPPKAGSGFVGSGSPTYTLSPSNQAALLAATKTVQTSDAGTTSTTGPAQHGTTRNGALYSAGAQGQSPVLVHSLIDGMLDPPKQRVEVVHNDPAATIVRNLGGCFEAE